MRPPSLKSVAKVAGAVLLLVLIRYFPALDEIGGSKRSGGPRRQYRRDSLLDQPFLKIGGDGGRPAANELPPIDPQQYMQNGYERDPELVKVVETHVPMSESIPKGFYPIEVIGDLHNPMAEEQTKVVFCKLDTEMYSRDPSLTPMFKDLVKKSSCGGANTRTVSLRSVSSMNSQLQPNGFVFHQSRVGSTLVANLLGSSHDHLVFSESAPPAACVLHCNGCTDNRKVHLLRVILNAMGNSATHKKLFFKFQSANTPLMELYTKAFPNTPWIYLFRDPVEIMVSHIGNDKGAVDRAPCLRSRRRAPAEVVRVLSAAPNAVSKAEYCAAHLNFLNQAPKNLLKAPGSFGRAVNYKNLPNEFIDDILPNHFGVDVSDEYKNAMISTSQHYSKARKGPQTWVNDTDTKHSRASSEMKLWAKNLMQGSYEELAHFDEQARNRHVIHEFVELEHSEESAPGFDLSSVDIESFLQPPFEETNSAYLPYPKLRPLPELLEQWPPDDTNIPTDPYVHSGSLEVLDFKNETQKKRAAYLRWHEVPFLLDGVPMIEGVKEKWTDEYLGKKFGGLPRKVTTSNTNHFMYFNKGKAEKYKRTSSYKAPTGMKDMTFREWLVKAKEAEHRPAETPHFYMQLGDKGPNRFISDDLPQFLPPKNFFIIDPRGNRGINCRFGARSIIAEAHYDGGRNFVAMLRGSKRYVLLPPHECPNLYLYPKSHPEGRHAEADWSRLNLTNYPKMANAMATEVILKAGQVLYIPSYWFHYIISLEQSAQCNSRSGNAIRGRKVVADCGFY